MTFTTKDIMDQINQLSINQIILIIYDLRSKHDISYWSEDKILYAPFVGVGWWAPSTVENAA